MYTRVTFQRFLLMDNNCYWVLRGSTYISNIMLDFEMVDCLRFVFCLTTTTMMCVIILTNNHIASYKLYGKRTLAWRCL